MVPGGPGEPARRASGGRGAGYRSGVSFATPEPPPEGDEPGGGAAPGGEGAEEAVGSRLSVKARQLTKKGRRVVGQLPTPEALAAMPPAKRHALLEGLRIELYAISSILAEGAVERAYRDRAEREPYGLVRSGHTDWRMVLASPHTVEEGSIDSFYALGKAYVDTMVFHLDRQFAEARQYETGWMLDRLESLLALFRVGAGPMAKGRMRDGLSFIYGGLHFGTGVSVQLVEVMNRLLDGDGGLGPEEKAEVMARSSRPAFRLAALNLDHVILVYHALLAPPERPGGPQWFEAGHFEVQRADGRPRAVDFRHDRLVAGKPHTPRVDTVSPTWVTHGCPARVSPTGASPPIARLWSWAVQLALDTGLLGDRSK
jgi:hypothetical protein